MSDVIASTAVNDNGANVPVLSKRAVQRLVEMQHALTLEVRKLSEQQSRFIGALMACDTATQQAMLLEYRDQLHAVHTIIAKLRILLERFCDDSDSAPRA